MTLADPFCLALMLPIALLWYLLPVGYARSVFLLLISYAYYLTFNVWFFPVLLSVTAVAFGGGLLLERYRERSWAVPLFIALLLASFAPLVTYKFLIPLMTSTTFGAGPNWELTLADVVLPVGLSFYTFGAVGYLIDVWLELLPAERDPVRLGLFCGLFSYVTAGPIPRATVVLPQLDLRRAPRSDAMMRGVTEILIGSAMKLWIADALTEPSASVYADLAGTIPLEKLVGTIFFAFQLYADFAGYSLIAIGSARLFGIDIPPNFRQPFLTATIPEFWRCWHISLFTWLRDYVFTPLRLQWRARPKLGSALAMFITLVLVGVWHGTGWAYIGFGVVHGLLMVGSQFTLPARDRFWASLHVPAALLRTVRIPITFLIVALTLVLIRVKTLDDAIIVYKSIFSWTMIKNLSALCLGGPSESLQFVHIHFEQNIVGIVLIGVLIIGDIVARSKTIEFQRWPGFARGFVYSSCTMVILYQAISETATKPFVYFQF